MENIILVAIIGAFAAIIVSIISSIVSLRTARKQKHFDNEKLKIDFLNQKIKIFESAKEKLLNTKDSNFGNSMGKDEVYGELASRMNYLHKVTAQVLKSISHYLNQNKYDKLINQCDQIEITIGLGKLEKTIGKKLKLKEGVKALDLSELVGEMNEFRDDTQNCVEQELKESIERMNNLMN